MRWWRRKSRDEDLDREIRSHLELEAEEQQESGLSPEGARYAAKRTLGNATLLKEGLREVWRCAPIDRLAQDLRYALRQVKKTPGFAIVVIATFALGIGVNSALFTITDAVLLKLLPVHDPQQLVLVGAGPGFAMPYPAYEEFRDHNQVFSSILAYTDTELTARFGNSSGRVHAQLISGSFFKTLGVGTILGRPILPSDARAGAAPSAVISFDVWQSRFGGSRDIIGRLLPLNNVPFTIVGVTNPRFRGVELGFEPTVYVPISLEPQLNPGSKRLVANTTWWIHILGRLRSGVSRQQAKAGLAPIFANFLQTAVREAPPDWPPGMKHAFLRQRIVVSNGSAGLSQLREQFREPLLALMGAALLVLLVACLNIANLLLARGVARRREMAVRLALGAARSRLIRQLLTESVLLASIGGVAGFLLGQAIEHVLGTRILGSIGSLQLSGDARVMLFTTAISLLGGCFFGLLPAVRVSRDDPAGTLREDSPDCPQGGCAKCPLAVLWSPRKSLPLLCSYPAPLFLSAPCRSLILSIEGSLAAESCCSP
ncbi:MAG: ABC transporter permease [Bryobacteraceae bacterium]